MLSVWINRDPPVFQILVTSGASVTIPTKHGDTASELALRVENQALVEALGQHEHDAQKKSVKQVSKIASV